METNQIIIFLLYKLSGIVAGTLFCYWGYKLFIENIIHEAGNLEVSNEKNKLSLLNAAPGTFFSVLGAFIIIVTLYKGANFSNEIIGQTFTQKENIIPKPLDSMTHSVSIDDYPEGMYIFYDTATKRYVTYIKKSVTLAPPMAK